MGDVLLGRQPVFDRDERVFGHELLCRSEESSPSSSLDGDRLTATVVLNAFVELGVEARVAGPTFVRMTPRFLLEDLYRSLPKERVVLTLEVEPLPPPAVAEALRIARMRGYGTALDRVREAESVHGLLGRADFARVDVASVGVAAAVRLCRTLRAAGAVPVATKVESGEAFRACHEAGYALFQGFYFRHPDVLRARRVPAVRVPVVELLARIGDPEVDLRRLVHIVERNPSLGVHVLRMARSAGGTGGPIGSIRHAVLRLGLERVRNGLSLVLLAGVDDEPEARGGTALVRARTCQLLARRTGSRREEAYFTTGLLSILDVVLGLPLDRALEVVPVDPALRRSILQRDDPCGLALEAALSCEERRAPSEAAFVRFGFRAIRESHLAALRWAREPLVPPRLPQRRR